MQSAVSNSLVPVNYDCALWPACHTCFKNFAHGRFCLATVRPGMYLKQIDVKTAYFNSHLDHDKWFLFHVGYKRLSGNTFANCTDHCAAWHRWRLTGVSCIRVNIVALDLGLNSYVSHRCLYYKIMCDICFFLLCSRWWVRVYILGSHMFDKWLGHFRGGRYWFISVC